MNLRIPLLACGTLLALVTTAMAQPDAPPLQPDADPLPMQESEPDAEPVAEPGTELSAEPVAEPAPAVEESRARQFLRRFTFGFHLFTGNLGSDQADAGSESLGIVGAFGRYRINKRFEAELEIRKLDASLPNGVKRVLKPFNVSVLVHFIERGKIDGYGRVGIGVGSEDLSSNGQRVLDDSTTHLHLGLGINYQVWKNIGVSAEMRYLRASRNDQEFVTSGPQVGLAAFYRF